MAAYTSKSSIKALQGSLFNHKNAKPAMKIDTWLEDKRNNRNGDYSPDSGETAHSIREPLGQNR